MNIMTSNTSLPRDLGEGLLLRRSTSADADALAAFNSVVHSDFGPDTPDDRLDAWTRDLLTRPHPTFQPGDFTIVEDSRSGKIVSSLNLIPQIWTYAGIEFGVGRPELVGTHPDYRHRGLIRHQFDEVHRWSLERGHLLQAITGIPNYYRQFGYEMALLLQGGRTGFEAQLPELKENETEPFIIRPAIVDDIPFLLQVQAHADRRNLVTCVWDAAQWRYELTGKSERNVTRREVRIIQSVQGEALGYLMHPWFNWKTGLVMAAYELKAGVSWMAVTPSVARYLWRTGADYAAREGKTRTAYAFKLGDSHPAYEVFRERLPLFRDPYAFYLRLPDLAGFLRHITPVLEGRLAVSDLVVGYTGQLCLNFYDRGLKLVFENGHLGSLDPWTPASSMDGDAAFPDQTFLQLLFGYRSFDELQQSFADCWDKSEEPRVLLKELFPKQTSLVTPVE